MHLLYNYFPDYCHVEVFRPSAIPSARSIAFVVNRETSKAVMDCTFGNFDIKKSTNCVNTSFSE